MDSEKTPSNPSEQSDLFKPRYLKSVKGVPSTENDTRDFENTRVMNITLRLSDNCNFNCSYCTYYDNKKLPPEIGRVRNLIRTTIDAIANRVDKIVWYIHGGEPTIYPNFTELISSIHFTSKEYEMDYEIEVQTNSSKRFPTRAFDKIHFTKTKFVCSFQQHQNKGIHQFLEFVEKAQKYKMLAGVDIILEDFENTNYKEIINLYYRLAQTKTQDYTIQLNTIDGKQVPEEYQDFYDEVQSKEWYTKEKVELNYHDGIELISVEQLIAEDKNKFMFFKCNVGLTSLILDTTELSTRGLSIYKCFNDYHENKPARQFWNQPGLLEAGPDNIDHFIGQNIRDLMKPTRCLYKKCICEIQIPKYR